MKATVIPKTLTPAARLSTSGAGLRARKSMICAATLLLLPATGLRAQSGGDPPEPFLPNPVQSVSTVPANGDQNPYGVAFVPAHFHGGTLAAGDILVSNFNNGKNLQGTGTTIVDVPANGGAPSVFFQGSSGLGLTTALAVLQDGLVLVGNLPTADGTCATAQQGSLLVIDSSGKLLQTIAEADLDGPWDMTVNEQGRGGALAFISSVLNGTVVRLDLKIGPGGVTVASHTVIASGYMHRCDPAALVVGPTGLVYDPARDILYVASTEDNEVFAVHNAGRTSHDLGTGRVVYKDDAHLHGPLGMALAPNGDLLVANSDVINSDPNQPSEIVEFTTGGRFVKQLSVDPQQGGSFGLAVATSRGVARFAAVDDVTGTLLIWTLPFP
jgi:hypothetical protein